MATRVFKTTITGLSLCLLAVQTAMAANAANEYVTASSSTSGVTEILRDDNGVDFYVIAPNAASSFKANISVAANTGWRLVSPASISLSSGGTASWKVENEKKGDEDTQSGNIILPHVEFDKKTVIVGIGTKRTSETPKHPATNPAAFPYRLTAKIKPARVASSVSFGSDNTGRATVGEVSRIADAGVVSVILKVTGITQTPKSAPEGDTKVIAKFMGIELASAKA